MATDNLAAFITSVSGGSLLSVEENLGGGFVRLKTEEAERRQAKQDIRCVEDIVIELLRNARDAHAKNIYVASSRDQNIRTLVVIDDGDGIPEHMHKHIFDARVTSKLETAHMDKWGIHGRGMALYSIRCNSKNSYVVASECGKGSAISISVDLGETPEKADQATKPRPAKGKDGALEVGKGPHNVVRTIIEFSLDCENQVRVFYGSPAEIASALYNAPYDTFTSETALAAQPSCATSAQELVESCKALGLELSLRTAHRIVAGEIKSASCPLSDFLPKTEDEPVDIYRDRRGLRLSKEDVVELQDRLEAAFAPIAQRYFLTLDQEPLVRVGKDAITVRFSIQKEE